MFGKDEKNRKARRHEEISAKLAMQENEEALKAQKEYVENMTRICHRVEDVFVDEGLEMKDMSTVIKYFTDRQNAVFSKVKFSEVKDTLEEIKKQTELKQIEKANAEKGEDDGDNKQK